ncbi:MAG: protein kinase [Sandaracinus sp.]
MARICQRCQHPNEDHAKFCLSCGAMLEVEVADQADPMVGKVIQGRYRPTRLLGEGGMGRVYEAEQKMGAATRKVAIKTLHPEFSQDPQIVARFNRECETVIELSHPNTIQFFDFGQLDDQTLFIVMEFIQGRALAAELEQTGALDPARVDKILIQVCGSLNEAHQRGIVHRDLKPDNILLTDRGGQHDFVKVLDFGIAKKGDAEDPQKAKLTKQGMVLGTPPYMSPEQFSGKQLDARSDIYSMGIVAYEMLTGQLPFDAKTPWEWATKHLTAPPTPFEAHPRGAAIAQYKKDAIMRALSKSPDQRQANILQFMSEVTGQSDVQQAWTNATSAAGVRPQTSPVPVPTGQLPLGTPPSFGANPSQPNLAPQLAPAQPFQQTSPLPAGMGVGAPPQQMAYAPSATPAPFGGATPVGGGYNTGAGMAYGAAPYGAAVAVPAPTPSSGGGTFLKVLVVGIVGLFVVGGIGVGAALFAFSGDPDPTTTTPTPTTTIGPVMHPISTTNPPPTTSVRPPPTTSVTPPPTTSVPPPTTSVTPPPTTSVTPPPTTSTRPPPTTSGGHDERHVSAADEATARRLAASGQGALQRGDFANAIATLQEIQRLTGRSSPPARELRTAIATRGSTAVGMQLARGNCPEAQRLYGQLRTVGAEREARGQFRDPRWCPAP